MRTVVLVVGALSSVAAVHAQVEARGEHFTVVGKGIDERTAKQALAAVEPVWPLVCEAFGVRRARPKEPLRVYLYRALADYVAADRERTGGRFAPNQAMSHWDSKTAHVAMQPPCADAWLERHGLPLQTQAMLAWEASHLARFELCRNFRSHPGWFYDGLAASVAERTLRERLPELGVAPFFEQKWRRVQRLLRNDELPAVSDLLGEGASDLDMRDRYAARIAFYRYAEEHAAKALRRVARAVRTTGGGSGYAAAVRKVAERQLGRLDRG
ncbi:MAG TPA: hypothetical protein ENI87_13215, partial [bacterium]|nr:hypothetical protein [bacterium]